MLKVNNFLKILYLKLRFEDWKFLISKLVIPEFRARSQTISPGILIVYLKLRAKLASNVSKNAPTANTLTVEL